MDRYAILVDAGYFFAAGAQTLAGKQVARRNISFVSPADAVAAIASQAVQQTSLHSLLRVYWYDALLGPRPSLEQTTIAHLAGVKLRLGSLNAAGEQKGVDSLIVTDLIELTRNRALSDAVLVSGDEDLRIAVQVAQTYGVRVHILAVGDPKNNVSPALQMEADSVGVLNHEWLKQHLKIATGGAKATAPQKVDTAPTSAKATNSVGPSQTSVEAVAQGICDELLRNVTTADVQALKIHFDSSRSVPPEYDGRLIAKTGVALGRQLTPEEKRHVRGMFVNGVRAANRT